MRSSGHKPGTELELAVAGGRRQIQDTGIGQTGSVQVCGRRIALLVDDVIFHPRGRKLGRQVMFEELWNIQLAVSQRTPTTNS